MIAAMISTGMLDSDAWNACASPEDDEIGIELREILRDLTLAIGIVEGIVDHLWRNAETGGLIAVDGDLELRPGRQEIAGRVGQLRQRAHLGEHSLRPFDQLVDVGGLECVLEATTAGASADIDVLGRSEEDVSPLDLRKLRAQAVDDL